MKKLNLVLLLCFSVIFVSCSSDKTEDKFKKSLISQKDGECISLKDVTDFEWDNVYFIAPYTDKEGIKTITGISSGRVMDNMSDESVLNILFVKSKKNGENSDKIVCQIVGRPENLGFDFIVKEYNKYYRLNDKNSTFVVKTVDGIKTFELQ